MAKTRVVAKDPDTRELYFTDKGLSTLSSMLQPFYQEGIRNQFIMYLSGVLKKAGLTEASAWNFIDEFCTRAKDEEKDARLNTVKRTYRMEEMNGIAGSSHLRTLIGNEPVDQLLEALDITWSLDEYAKHITQTFQLATLQDTGEILTYEDGIYTNRENKALITIKKELDSLDPDMKQSEVNEILEKVKIRTSIERSEFDKDPLALHFKNGYFDLNTWTFEEHNADSYKRYSLSKSEVEYNENAKCPTIVKFLEDRLDETNRELFLRMVGFIFLPGYTFKKLFVLIGDTDSGKTTAIGLISSLIGGRLVASVNFSDMDKPYMDAELFGKWANLGSEITKAHVVNTGLVKRLTGSDPITTRKIRQEPFTFYNRAKIIIAVNDMPNFENADNATLNRVITIDFDRTVSKDEIDRTLPERMSTPEELSGFLNLAIGALKRLLEENSFNEPELDEKIKEYTERTSELKDFVKEECDLISTLRVEKEELRKLYIDWCAKTQRRPLPENEFGKELINKHGVTSERIREGNKRKYVYLGIGKKEVRLQ